MRNHIKVLPDTDLDSELHWLSLTGWLLLRCYFSIVALYMVFDLTADMDVIRKKHLKELEELGRWIAKKNVEENANGNKKSGSAQFKEGTG